MKKDDVLNLIKKKATQDEKHRKDPRFVAAMGFFVAKGFLKTNINVPMMPNKRLKIKDVMWAANNVEPRILEVLPAAIVRLERHFDLDAKKYPELAKVVMQLKKKQAQGDAFNGIPYDKLKVWTELVLKDGRVKPLAEKKILKTYRLKPAVDFEIKKRAKEWNCSESEVLERVLEDKVTLMTGQSGRI